MDCTDVLLIFLCFLVPPVVVGIKDRMCGPHFWISIMLLFPFVVPSIIHGIYIVCTRPSLNDKEGRARFMAENQPRGKVKYPKDQLPFHVSSQDIELASYSAQSNPPAPVTAIATATATVTAPRPPPPPPPPPQQHSQSLPEPPSRNIRLHSSRNFSPSSPIQEHTGTYPALPASPPRPANPKARFLEEEREINRQREIDQGASSSSSSRQLPPPAYDPSDGASLFQDTYDH